MQTVPNFVLPNRALVQEAAGSVATAYAIYNYYGRGPIAASKRMRFQRALRLGGKHEAEGVIDMGCADGLLLPSLCQTYDKVAAVDINQSFIDRSHRLGEALQLQNVTYHCNADRDMTWLRQRLGSGYQLMYLLETLEHLGDPADMWGSKMRFLEECFTLLDEGGKIVISVPKMVGLIVLFKNLLQRCLGLGHDKLTMRQLLRSALLHDTEELEPLWDGHHVGFNHLKLDRHLAHNFRIHERRESAISVFYVIGRK